jgi:hypothetical protein
MPSVVWASYEDPSKPDVIHNLSYEGMRQIFVLIKQDCARLLFGWLGVEDGPVTPEELKDLAF